MLNRAILGSTILCIAFSNLLMSDKNNLLDRNRRIKLTLTSIFTAFGMFLIAIFVLRVILDSDFTDEIFYILLYYNIKISNYFSFNHISP